MTTAIVFAYHSVGVRCIKVLLDQGIKIPLIVTHKNNPNETIWFESVSQLALEHGIPSITPDDPNTAPLIEQLTALNPDFIFSFYYRHLLKQQLLELPKQGAFNMHGSYLPDYRGRVPINWAMIHGETQSGATLHEMTLKPDEGAIVDQMAVPILRDDSAQDLFNKVCVASEIVLQRSLPLLRQGKATLNPQDPKTGSYFSGRKPENGRIPADLNAEEVHNFVRALTTPYPGAFIEMNGKDVFIWKTRIIESDNCRGTTETLGKHKFECHSDQIIFHAKGGGSLVILALSQGDLFYSVGEDSSNAASIAEWQSKLTER